LYRVLWSLLLCNLQCHLASATSARLFFTFLFFFSSEFL
jgi:hypothetical protein